MEVGRVIRLKMIGVKEEEEEDKEDAKDRQREMEMDDRKLLGRINKRKHSKEEEEE